MSEEKNKQDRKKVVFKKVIDARREMQYSVLMSWHNKELTARQCIEGIIELEKIIPLGDILKEPPVPKKEN